MGKKTENAKSRTFNETSTNVVRYSSFFRFCITTIWGPNCIYVDKLVTNSCNNSCITQMQTFDLRLFTGASLVAQEVKNPPAMRETWA